MPSLRQRYRDIDQTPDLPPEQERRYVLHGMQRVPRAGGADPAAGPAVRGSPLGGRVDAAAAGAPRPRSWRTCRILVIGTYRTDRPVGRATVRPLPGASHPPAPRDRDPAASARPRRGGPALPASGRQHATGRRWSISSYAESDGNPFFAEETVRHLLGDRQVVRRRGPVAQRRSASARPRCPGRWRCSSGGGWTTLQPATRKVLAAAAVIGRVFPFQLLATVSATDDDALFDALEDAERHHIIVEDAHGGDARYSFVHEQFRQVAAARVLVAAPSAPAPPHRRRAGGRGRGRARRAPTSRSPTTSSSPVRPPRRSRTAAALVASARAALAALGVRGRAATPRTGGCARRASRIPRRGRRRWRCRPPPCAAAVSVGRGARRPRLGVAGGPAAGPTRASILLQRSQLLLDLFRALGGARRPRRRPRAASARRRSARRAGGAARAGSRRLHHVARPPGVRPPARATYEEALRLAEELGDGARW